MNGKKLRIRWKISYSCISVCELFLFPSTCLCFASTIEFTCVYLLSGSFLSCSAREIRLIQFYHSFVCLFRSVLNVLIHVCIYGNVFIVLSATVANPMHIEWNFNGEWNKDFQMNFQWNLIARLHTHLWSHCAFLIFIHLNVCDSHFKILIVFAQFFADFNCVLERK